ncbi:bifunctional riboflavin kinase/FAD synthetase [Candidatus Poribacteria bacterium]|nr:bifunctional riboflavin kinase/FAD synthetase [Candidatus Poribacteria bacterium]
MEVILPNGVVLSFGVFDGVHIAHQIVIKKVVNRARELGIGSVIISFDPHPALSVSGKAPLSLMTVKKKVEILKSMGIDEVIVENFNTNFSQLSPEQFVKEILIDRFNAKEIIVGYDCAFGKNKSGNKKKLKDLGKKYGFNVDIVEPYMFNGEIVSSTRIRNAIIEGKIKLAEKLLGRPYSISGVIEHGKGIGHKIGYATANLHQKDQVLPPFGVYAVKVYLREKQYGGILNMGMQPTFGADRFRIEVHLMGFQGSLYGENMEVLFISKIRDEKTFSSSRELAEQIKRDEVAARKILYS